MATAEKAAAEATAERAAAGATAETRAAEGEAAGVTSRPRLRFCGRERQRVRGVVPTSEAAPTGATRPNAPAGNIGVPLKSARSATSSLPSEVGAGREKKRFGAAGVRGAAENVVGAVALVNATSGL